jgi:hypothetical protein
MPPSQRRAAAGPVAEVLTQQQQPVAKGISASSRGSPFWPSIECRSALSAGGSIIASASGDRPRRGDLDPIVPTGGSNGPRLSADRIDPVISGRVDEHLIFKQLAEQPDGPRPLDPRDSA